MNKIVEVTENYIVFNKDKNSKFYGRYEVRSHELLIKNYEEFKGFTEKETRLIAPTLSWYSRQEKFKNTGFKFSVTDKKQYSNEDLIKSLQKKEILISSHLSSKKEDSMYIHDIYSHWIPTTELVSKKFWNILPSLAEEILPEDYDKMANFIDACSLFGTGVLIQSGGLIDTIVDHMDSDRDLILKYPRMRDLTQVVISETVRSQNQDFKNSFLYTNSKKIARINAHLDSIFYPHLELP